MGGSRRVVHASFQRALARLERDPASRSRIPPGRLVKLMVEAAKKENAPIFQFIEAVRKGDDGRFGELLPAVDVNQRDRIARVAAVEAAKNGRTDYLKKLKSAGADFNRPDKWGRTPLMEAARYGHEDTVDYLLLPENNVNVDLTDRRGRAALTDAVGEHHDSIAAKIRVRTRAHRIWAERMDGRSKTQG